MFTDILIPSLAVFTSVIILTIVVFIWWYIETNLYQLTALKARHYDLVIELQVSSFWNTAFILLFAIPEFIIISVLSLIAFIRANFVTIIALSLLAIIGVGWLEYHDDILEVYIVTRQCFLRTFIDFFMYPILNSFRMFFNLLWPFINFFYEIFKFFLRGHWKVLFGCLNTNGISVWFQQMGKFVSELMLDFSDFFISDIFADRWDITNSLFELGIWIDMTVPILDCFCSILDFIWSDIGQFAQLASLHRLIDCAWNTIVRILQILLFAIREMVLPSIENTVIELCCAFQALGDTLEDVVFILAETFYGLITQQPSLPPEIEEILDIPYTHIFSEPACALIKLGNMTVEAVLHIDQVFAADGSGVGYFQFGFILDHIRVAADAFGCIFIIISDDFKCIVTKILLALIEIVDAILEFIPGLIFFFFFPCCQNPFDFAVDYWFTPGNSLNEWFDRMKDATLCLQQILDGLNEGFACLIKHILDALIEFLRIVTQFFIFLFDVITFQPFPSLDDIDLQPWFDELLVACRCLGDVFRQFDVDLCIPQPDDIKQNWICCTAELVEAVCQLIINVIIEVILFAQDIVSLLSGSVMLENVHIPNFGQALAEAEKAICNFACSVATFIPVSFFCEFPNPAIECDSAQTCGANTLCALIRIILIPFYIANEFLVKVLSGTLFSSFTEFFEFIINLFVAWLAGYWRSQGAILDCLICIVFSGGNDCDDVIFTVFDSTATLFEEVVGLFTDLFLKVLDLILEFFISFFVDGDPVGAVIRFVIDVITEIIGGLGAQLVMFIVQFLNELGLGFIGAFVQALFLALCPVLEFVLNAVITILRILTFGLVQIDTVTFCCEGGECVPNAGKKRDENDDNIKFTLNNWIEKTIEKVQWDESDPCNKTLSSYSTTEWQDLDRFQRYEPFYCLSKYYWFRDINESTVSPPSKITTASGGDISPILLNYSNYDIEKTKNEKLFFTPKCDIIMEEYITRNVDWTNDLTILEKATIMECLESRLFIDTLRIQKGLYWIPKDILYNGYRPLIFGFQLFRGYMVYWQYTSDRMFTPSTILQKEYKERWKQIGFYTGHLDGIETEEQLKKMLELTHIEDYFNWNNATQVEAVKETTTAFWRIIGKGLEGLVKTVSSSKDPETDIRIILQEDADMRSKQIISTFNYILYDFFAILKKIADHWSNPDNLKRATQAGLKIARGTQEALKLASRKLRLMAIDWADKKVKESELAKGIGTEKEIEEYKLKKEEEMREATSSLSSWWQRKFPKVYPKPGRNTTYKNDIPLFYKGRDGKMMNESIWDRLYRTVDTIRKGTHHSNRRWDKIIRLHHHVRARFVYNIIKSNYTSRNEPIPEEYTKENLGLKSNYYHTSNSKTYAEESKKRQIIDIPGGILDLVVTLIFPPATSFIGILIGSIGTNITSQDCTSDIDFLCENCFYLDQFVGVIISALTKLIEYFAGGRFEQSAIEGQAFFDYTFDTNATVIVGDGPDVPVRPWHPSFSILRYLGDNDTKIRFDDIVNFTNTLPPPTNDIEDNIINGTLNGLFTNIFISITGTTITNAIEQAKRFLIGDENSGEGFITFILDWFISCNWVEGTEFDCSQKRFSTGEMVLMVIIALLVWAFVIALIVPNVVTSFVLSLLTFTILFSVFLIIQYTWSWSCFPALPLCLGNDLFEFLVFQLYPKCMWLFSGLINEEYTNDNCYSCEFTRNITFANCKNDLMFQDFIDNIFFTLQFYAPSVLDAWRNTTSPLFILLQIPYLNEKVNRWVDIDFSDHIIRSQLLTCNWMITPIVNWIIFSLFILVFIRGLFPIIALLMRLLFRFIFWIILWFYLIDNMLQSLFFLSEYTAYPMAGITEEWPTGMRSSSRRSGGSGGGGGNFGGGYTENTQFGSADTNTRTHISSNDGSVFKKLQTSETVNRRRPPAKQKKDKLPSSPPPIPKKQQNDTTTTELTDFSSFGNIFGKDNKTEEDKKKK